MAGARRQVDDGKGGQWRSVAIPRIRILLVNKLFDFRSNRSMKRSRGVLQISFSTTLSLLSKFEEKDVSSRRRVGDAK